MNEGKIRPFLAFITSEIVVEIPNKQPLRNITIITKDTDKVNDISNVKDIILNELNIKELTFDNNFENWVKYDCKPNYSTLGPKLGNKIGKFGEYLSNLKQEDIEDLISKKYIEFKNEKIPKANKLEIIIPEGPSQMTFNEF